MLRRFAVFAFTLLLSGPPLRAQGAAASTPPLAAWAWRARVDSLTRIGDRSVRLMEAWRGLGEALNREGKVDSAVVAYREAVRASMSLPDDSLKAELYAVMGSQFLRANQSDSALPYIARARALRLSLGDSIGAIRTWNNTGAAQYQIGNYEEALNAFLQALEGRRLERDTVGIARVLANIGKVYEDWGQFDRAETRLREAVTLARTSGNAAILGYALSSLAQVHMRRGDYERAFRTIGESMAAYADRSSSRAPEVVTQDSLSGWRLNALVRAEALLRLGRAGEAIPLLDSITLVGKENGNIRSIARSQMLLGEGYAQIGQLARARALLRQSIDLSRSVEQRVYMLQAFERLSQVEEQAGNAPASLRALRAATALRDTIFNQATAQRLAAEEGREERDRQQRENAALRDAQRQQAEVIERQRIIVSLVLLILGLSALLVFVLVRFNRLGRAREVALSQANEELRAALNDVRTLKGLIPICANCKRIRDDRGYWQAVESYIASRSDATFSHGICQSCGPELYGDMWPEQQDPLPPQRNGSGP